MQRLFAMFPQGGPGVALLLLRISVAATLLITFANRFGVNAHPWLFAAIALSAILLCIGFLIPIVSVIACTFGAANLLIGFNSSNLIYVFMILDAAALALLGPGAYSVDARLFGRRVTVVASRTDKKRS